MSGVSWLRRDAAEDASWISVSDLMAGLMVIFLFIAIAFMRHEASERRDAELAMKAAQDARELADAQRRELAALRERVRRIAVAYRDTEEALYQALVEEFRDLLSSGRVTIDRQTLTVSFRPANDGDPFFFTAGSAAVPPAFARMLDQFVPRYVAILNEPRFKDAVVEVRIEGHTSSEYGAWTGYKAYLPNLELSQARTRSIVDAVMARLPEEGPRTSHRRWLMARLSADGLSSSQPVRREDCEPAQEASCEDAVKSRRVAFRARTASERRLRRILEELDSGTLGGRSP